VSELRRDEVEDCRLPVSGWRFQILRYLDDEKMRDTVQLQLNHGEHRHDLTRRCLFFANRGEFRTGDLEEIMNKASCLSLLSNAVLVWNTVRSTEIVARLRASGEEILDSDLARVSPLCRAHIIPAGTPTRLTQRFRGAILRTIRYRKFSRGCCRWA
jgi:hypothetical protein